MQTDLEILEKTKELYLQQEDPTNGYWAVGYKPWKTVEAHNCLCIEGCLIAAMGYDNNYVKNLLEEDEKDESFDVDAFSKWYKELQNSSVFKKLARAAGQDPSTGHAHIYSINHDKAIVLLALNVAISTEQQRA